MDAEAPPAYSVAPAPVPKKVKPVETGKNRKDDRYSFLETFDTIFLIDDSDSMQGSRWEETSAALKTITPICTQYDADGIDIHFLNEKRVYRNIQSVSDVQSIFGSVRPERGTPTGQRLNNILRSYIKEFAANPKSVKPINIICITDGEPSDDVESPLIAAAKKLDKLDAPDWQVGVQFFQVGKDKVAKHHLKQLDDELANIAGDDELRDIVDTIPFTGDEGKKLTGEGILKVVLGAVNRRLDREQGKGLHE